MSIPDALGGDDKALSDVGDSVRQTLNLPEALRTEAHAETLPLSAPKSDVLPQVTLAQPPDSVTLPIGNPAPIRVVEASQPTTPTTAQLAAIKLDGNAPQTIPAKPVEIAAAVPPIGTLPIGNPAPIRVVEASQPATLTTAQLAAIKLDGNAPQIIPAKPVEIAAAVPPIGTLPIGNPAPIRVVEASQPATLTTAQLAAIKLDGNAPQIIPAKPVEIAAAVPPIGTLPIGNPAPIRVVEASQPATLTTAQLAAIKLDGNAPQIIPAKPVEIAAAVPPIGTLPIGNPAPIRVVEASQPATLTTAQLAAIKLDGNAPQIIPAKPVEIAAAVPPIGTLPIGNPAPIRVVEASQPATLTTAQLAAIKLDGNAPQIIPAKPVEIAAAVPPIGTLPIGNPAPIRVVEASQPATLTTAQLAAIKLDGNAPQIIPAKPVEIAAAVPPIGTLPIGNPAPIRVVEASQPATLTTAQLATIKLDGNAPQIIPAKPVEIAAAVPPIGTLPIGNPAPIRVVEASEPATLTTAQLATIKLDGNAPQIIVATNIPIATLQVDRPAAKIIDNKLASLTGTVLPQLTYAGPPKGEISSEATNISSLPRIQFNPQLAITREATQDLAAATQSYNRSVSPESKTTNSPTPGSDSQGVNQVHPGITPAVPAPKDGGKTVLPPDPPTLLAALEAAATRKASTPGTTSAFIDGTVSTGKLGLSPLQGALNTVDIHTTQIAQAGGVPVPVSLDGRLVQNPNQTGVTDTTSGAIDPRKGLGNTIPGTLGPGITTEQPEGRDNKRILDVPDLNLDDKTGQLTDRKGKGDHETNQPDTGKTNREEQAAIAAAELANLLNRVKKGQKENSEQDGKVDATGAAQVLAGSTRLKHKVRLGETLSEISITYFNDDIATTLIMQINYSLLEIRVHNYGVAVSLPADLIIDIPSDAEVAEFKKQLIAGTQTLVNITYDD